MLSEEAGKGMALGVVTGADWLAGVVVVLLRHAFSAWGMVNTDRAPALPVPLQAAGKLTQMRRVFVILLAQGLLFCSVLSLVIVSDWAEAPGCWSRSGDPPAGMVLGVGSLSLMRPGGARGL